MSKNKFLVLLVLALYFTTARASKHGRKHQYKIYSSDDPTFSTPGHVSSKRNAVEKALPSFMELISSSKSIKDGTKYSYHGCDIDVTKGGTSFDLDLTAASCKNVVSLKKLYEHLTKGKPDASTSKFAALEKFDVNRVSIDTETKRVAFEAKSKEPFDLIKGIQVGGEIKLQFKYSGKTSNIFQSIGIDLKGKITKDNLKLNYSLEKKEGKNSGKFKITVDQIKITDFYRLFSNNREMTDNDAVDDNSLTDATITDPIIEGTRDEQGNTEIIMAAMVSGISGVGRASVTCVVAAGSNGPTDVGVIVQLNQVSPATILAKFIKGGKFKLDEIPVFKDIKITVIFEYGTNTIIPEDLSVKKILQSVSPSGEAQITSGLKMKFMLPLEQVLKANGAQAPPGTNLNQYVTVTIIDGKVNFNFPPNAAMDIINIAIAFVPTLSKAGLEKIFKDDPPEVTFNKFQVDVRDGTVDIDLKAKGHLGFKFLSVDYLAFTLKRNKVGKWNFSLDASKKVGQGQMHFNMRKSGEEYLIVGKLNAITTTDVAETFSVDSAVRKKLEGLKSFKAALSDVDLSIAFGNKIKAHLKGKITFLRIQAIFEGYLVQTDDGSISVAFGIVLHNNNIMELAKDFFKEEAGKDIDIVEGELFSSVTTSLIFGNKAGVDKIKFEDSFLQKATKPRDTGVSVFVDIVIPENCKNDVLCKFVQRLSSAGQHLSLNGLFDKQGIELSVKFNGELPLDKEGKYKIKNVGLAVSAQFTGLPDIGIFGEMDIEFENQPKATFAAKLSLSAGGTVELMLELKGKLQPAFGIGGLGLENCKLEASINVISALPEFSLSGIIRVGTSNTPVETKLAGGFDASSGKIYAYGEFKHWTVQKTLEAFNVNEDRIARIPKSILETGFPSAAAGLSLPTSTTLKHLNVKLDTGFFFKGTMNLLGNNIQAEIKVALPTILVKARFSKISLASGMIQLTSVDRKEGPEFKLEIGPKQFSLQIDAYIEIFRVGLGAIIDISPKGFKFMIGGRFFDMFTLSLNISAPFSDDITAIPASDWKISGCFDSTVSSSVLSNAKTEVESANEAAEDAEDDAGDLSKMGGFFESAQKKLDKYKKDLASYEKDLEFQISEAERKAVKYVKKWGSKAKTCVDECKKDKNMVSIGHLVMKKCPSDPSIDCPAFVTNSDKVLSPSCIAKCNQKNFLYTSMLSVTRGTKFKTIKAFVAFYSKVLSKLQGFLIKGKRVWDNANSAKGILTSIKEKAGKLKDLASKAKDWVKSNILNIEKLCLNSQLTKGSACFGVDAKLIVFKKEIKLENERACLSKQGMKDFAVNLLKKVLPNYDEVKGKAMQIKNLLFASKEEKVEDAQKDLEKTEDEANKKRTLLESNEETPYDARLNAIMSKIPQFVMRNDESVMAVRNFFVERDDVTSGDAPSEQRSGTEQTTLLIDIDSVTLSNRDDICRRSAGIVNLYAGVSDSLNAVLKSNKKAKSAYENVTTSWTKTFQSLEKETMAKAHMNNLTDFETSEMLFYVNYGKEGLANWKKQYDQKFTRFDKHSLSGWRRQMSKKVHEKNLDMKHFMGLLSQATQEVSKRCEVPGRENEMLENMSYAEEMLKTMLQKDHEGFVTHEKTITYLANAVNNLKVLEGNCQRQAY